MKIIYKSLDTKLEYYLAFKFLPYVFSLNDEFKLSIFKESKIAAKLEHYILSTIHEVGVTPDSQFFITMAYYEIETLKRKLKKLDG